MWLESHFTMPQPLPPWVFANLTKGKVNFPKIDKQTLKKKPNIPHEIDPSNYSG